MIIVKTFAAAADLTEAPTLTVELPYDLRKKSRLRVTATCGRDVGIQLPRGSELLDGQHLRAEDGSLIEVKAAAETVSTVTADDALLLMRAAYHLGNRHMPLQIAEHWLRYQHDHVLDDMVMGLGLAVTVEQAPFQPESGAYHRHGHSHSHSHSNARSGGHDHGHEADHGHAH